MLLKYIRNMNSPLFSAFGNTNEYDTRYTKILCFFSPFIINIITISILEEEIGVSQGSISKECLKRENEKKMKILVRENTFFFHSK